MGMDKSRPKGPSYLSVIRAASCEQRLERVVAGNKEANKVDQEGASNIKEDQEDVDSKQAEDGIRLGHRGLSLQVVEDRVLGELYHGTEQQDLSLRSALQNTSGGGSDKGQKNPCT